LSWDGGRGGTSREYHEQAVLSLGKNGLKSGTSACDLRVIPRPRDLVYSVLLVEKITSFVIVDDHKAVVDSLAYALEKRKRMACVGKYYSIAEAIAQLPSSAADIAIVDWRFGDGTGSELLQHAVIAQKQTKWLLCTATPTAYVLREALVAGVNGCVAKSCNFEEVATAVEALASGQSYFCKASQGAMVTSLAMGGQKLNATEVSVLRLVARGLEPKSIAAELHLSEKTIYNNLGFIRGRLKSHGAAGSMVDLARFAREQGIVPE
jgi:DNA-binding NarL/FixJ family response regulator